MCSIIPSWIQHHQEFGNNNTSSCLCYVMSCHRHQMLSPMKLWMIWWKHGIWHVIITIATEQTYLFSLSTCWFASCSDFHSIFGHSSSPNWMNGPCCWCGFVLLTRVGFRWAIVTRSGWFRSLLFCVSIPTHARRLKLGDSSHCPLFLGSSLTFDVLREGDECWA